MLRGPAEMEILEPADERAQPALLDPDYLFRSYSAYVAAIAHRLLGRDLDVDDTVQEVFVIAVRGASAIRDVNAVKGWLARVTVRVARRRLRARRLWAALGMDQEPGYETVADGSASPEQRALLMQVYRVLDRLPANVRIAWVLRNIEGEQLDSVAALCRCSLATAKRRIAQADRTLQEALEHE
jgi:RNA polymerase sigma-70 factor (ECF subfamily)